MENNERQGYWQFAPDGQTYSFYPSADGLVPWRVIRPRRTSHWVIGRAYTCQANGKELLPGWVAVIPEPEKDARN